MFEANKEPGQLNPAELRVLAVGYNAFDVIVPVDGLPEPDTKAMTGGIRIGGGGPAATASIALAKLGAQVEIVTPLTTDLPGQLQRAELEAAGVQLRRSPEISGGESPKAVILVDSRRQQRTIFWSRGDLPLLRPELAEPQWLDEVDLLYCDGHEVPLATRLAGWAKRRSIPVVLDAGSVREGSAELVGLCSDVISSESFAPALTGFKDPIQALQALSQAGPSRVAMTFGDRGVLGWIDEKPIAVPAFDVEVVDTTGAGDAYHAGYALARGLGRSFPDSLVFAAAVAACKCRDWGGRRGLPDFEQASSLVSAGRRRGVDSAWKGIPILPE